MGRNGTIEEQLPKTSVGRLSVDCRPTVHRQTINSRAANRLKLTLVWWRKLILKLSFFPWRLNMNSYNENFIIDQQLSYSLTTIESAVCLPTFGGQSDGRQTADRFFGEHYLWMVWTGTSAVGSSRRIHKDPRLNSNRGQWGKF